MEDGGWRMEDGGRGNNPSIFNLPFSILDFLCVSVPLWQNRLLEMTGPSMKAFLGFVLTLFVVLAVLASRFPYFELDVRLAREIQSITLPGFKTLMIGISWAGSDWVPWVLTCATGSVLLLFRLRL